MKVFLDDKELESLYLTGQSRKLKLPEQVVNKFFATIQKIDAAVDIHDLLSDKGWRFEKLKGFEQRYSMRLSQKYRLEMNITWVNESCTIGVFFCSLFQITMLNSMMSTAQSRPAKKFGSGYFIREQIELRDWNQEDFAEVTGFSQKHISEVLNNKKSVSIDMARILAEVFDTSAQYWLNLDNAYQLWLHDTPTKKEEIAETKAQIYARMPVRDMIKKGWLLPPLDVTDLRNQTLKFWDKTELDFRDIDENLLPFLTQKSDGYNKFNASYAITWYRKAQMEAVQIQVGNYQRQKLEELYERIAVYTISENGIPDFLDELGRVGVKFLLLPHLEKTNLDGAAFFSNGNPTVVYTGRYKRIDHFWFTLAHELAHILLHLNEKIPFILDNLHDGENSAIEEEETNAMASKMLKHPEILETLKDELHYLNTNRVEECAATYGIHPSIVIGKLAHEGKMHFRNIHLYNGNVLELIPEQYRK
ncbi:MAG: type II toxin-antitoxin system RelE/ParE family toxin [Saprospiraceae bacterium]|nr:type II toxin-antitoxin system RelE/ParE family toxin [Saprospiraceae bacterium]